MSIPWIHPGIKCGQEGEIPDLLIHKRTSCFISFIRWELNYAYFHLVVVVVGELSLLDLKCRKSFTILHKTISRMDSVVVDEVKLKLLTRVANMYGICTHAKYYHSIVSSRCTKTIYVCSFG